MPTRLLGLSIFIGTALLTACAMLQKTPNEERYLASAASNLESSPFLTIESCNQIIKINNANFEAYYLRGVAYQKTSNPGLAESDFQQALKLSPDNESTMIAYANLLCSMQNYTKAQAYYTLAYKYAKQTNRSLTSIYINDADCLTTQNKLEPAINNYTSALADENAPITAYIGIAHAYLLQDNYPTANYYLSLYKGTPTKQYLQIKLITLSNLLKNNLKPVDRSNFEQSLLLTEEQLKAATLSNNGDNQVQDKIKATELINEPNNNEAKFTSNGASKQRNKPNFSKLMPRIKSSAEDRNYIIIKPGDTLFRISIDSNINIERLKEINHLKNNEVVTGSKLFLN